MHLKQNDLDKTARTASKITGATAGTRALCRSSRSQQANAEHFSLSKLSNSVCDCGLNASTSIIILSFHSMRD